MNYTALKVIESLPFYKREIEYVGEESHEGSHSLHYSLDLPTSFCPELPAFFINKFSKRGEVVLDPFCGTGATSLEAALSGRLAFSSDIDPLSIEVTRAKLIPADLTEVTLKLQLINLKRPVGLGNFNQVFSHFYDIDTYRELINLKNFIASTSDRTSRFINLLAMSLLHGNNAGYFSVYSMPHISLSPEEQRQINFKRGQSADYRPLAPRLLRKAAYVFRDGVPSVLHQNMQQHRLTLTDARDLSYVANSSVNLVVTAPPLPFSEFNPEDQWLKYWFAGFTTKNLEVSYSQIKDIPSWLEFMNEVLLELARTVKGGGRAVFDLREIKCGNQSFFLDEKLTEMTRSCLSQYWEVEGVLVEKQRSAKLKDCSKERDQMKLVKRSRALVLRRK